jgi:hypothetical protein
MSPTDREIHNALTAIHARLGTIDGKVTLVARSQRQPILAHFAAVIRRTPLVAQIYLVLDGRRTQREVVAELAKYGIEVHEATVSRRIGDMVTEHGIVELVGAGSAKVYAKNREMNDVLNLATNMRKWLEDAGHPVPLPPPKRRKATS